jgi:hypothetical protein
MIGRWMMIGFVAGLLSMAGCAAMTEKTMREKGLAPMTQSELEAFYSRNRAFNFANYAGWKGNGTSHVGGTIAVNPNTVHLMIAMHPLKSIGAEGLEPRGRNGKLLILRLTPRGHLRLRLDTTRSCRISSSNAS